MSLFLPDEADSRAAKFTSVTSIALFFPHNESEGDDEETTRVYYVGLRGSWKPVSRLSYDRRECVWRQVIWKTLTSASKQA